MNLIVSSSSLRRFTASSPAKSLKSLSTRTSNIGRTVAFAALASITLATVVQIRSEALLDSGVIEASTAAAEANIRTDPDSGLSFPETLVIPSKARFPPFTLVGLGVRKVSFLGIKVYSVGFYADLSNPSLKVPENLPTEEKLEYIVRNTACVLRIIPTRSTSYTHLRDGFMRTLQARMTAALKSGTLSPDEAEEAQSPLRKLKSAFPNTPLAKGDTLDIILAAPPKAADTPRSLIIRGLGSVENNWVAREFVLAYFAGTGISPPMKKSAMDAIESGILLTT
ncbi:hypothetical protein SCHPADRAFT_934335 [Schizopora paradoxa]|uniref:Chalcone isomerase domain-containing protein n=1 Tax=Schizopora paradoxa TaxID=27342 RepID=A0A0H2SFD6_9AGAM|nr:hypothetical protein SCHPADRAFT_934335 [Schizopora paradoxa]